MTGHSPVHQAIGTPAVSGGSLQALTVVFSDDEDEF